MQILITVPVDALFDDIWNPDNVLPYALLGKREEFNREESAWAYYRMLRDRIRTEYPNVSLHIDLDWATPCECGNVEIDVVIMPGEKKARMPVLERIERIEDDVWASYPEWLVRAG